jgi:DNA replication protein DnaC
MARVKRESEQVPFDERAADRQRCYFRIVRDLGSRYCWRNVDRFEIYDPRQERVHHQMLAVAPQLPQLVSRGQGLIWYGHVGTGKDHMMAWLLHQAAGRFGIHCRWVRGLDLYGRLRDGMKSGAGGGTEEALLNLWTEPQVLAVSDPIPPANELSDWRQEFLQRLIDRRYRDLKSTWATMNVSNLDEADGILSNQVFDRLQEGAKKFACFWPSYRERQPLTEAV